MNTNEELEKMYKRIKDTPIKKFGRLSMIYVRIIVLLDYIKLINENGQNLLTPASKRAIETGQEPAIQLYDYLILEVCSFYDYVNELKKRHIEMHFLEMPDYLGKIYTFRNSIPGHVDRDEKLKSGEDFIDAYRPIFRDIGIERILIDFENYYQECRKMFGDEAL